MDYWKLIGILIIVLGFTLKFDVLAVVLIAGLTTGMVAGLSFYEILTILGQSFVSNRLMSIFLIIFPIIAIIERHGLKERAGELIGRIRNASAGKILSIYMVIRSLASALNIRIGGHVQFIRPLILPMSEAAAERFHGEKLSESQNDHLKGLAGAVENYGNFFAQNCFPAASGVVLIQGTMSELGYPMTLQSIASAAVPVALITVVLTIIQVKLYDRKLKNKQEVKHE